MPTTEHYEEYFYDLRTGLNGDHERPHKPIMLLSVMDLIQAGTLSENLIPFSKELKRQFTIYFNLVKSSNDRNTPINPYFYLRSEPFWGHAATSGNEVAVQSLSSPPAMRDLSNLITGATLNPDLWLIMNDPASRSKLRDVLISRYFPLKRKALLQVANDTELQKEEDQALLTPSRSAGFRKIVTQVYEHQCAACGLRLRLPDGSTIVEAAHIIPFSESQNDHPRNGLALCKNHHWAMDRLLISPSSNHTWLTSKDLDPRQPGEKELIALANQRIILPKEQAFHPLPEALAWREQRLV